MCSRPITASPENATQPTPTRRRTWLSVLIAVLILCGLITHVFRWRFVVLNLSPSIAPGLYVAVDAQPVAGQLAEFPLPQTFRGAFPECSACAREDTLILKPIAAGPGDHVDTTGGWLVINGARLAPIHTHDSQGHAVPVWRAKRVLCSDEFFVFSVRVPNSLDSRYFGPIQRTDIVAVRAPLVTW